VKVRQPSFDFADVSPRWAPNTDAVRMLNAMGIIPAHIEPYLIKVMRAARARLDPLQYPDLVADIDVFIRQEAQHYKLHSALNRWIREGGYPGMAGLESDYAADLAHQLAERSLRFNLAYCEGFEASGSAAAALFLDDDFAEQFGGGDQRPLELWQWHLAEEYEHRSVVFRTYHALYGDHRVIAYVYRLYGLFSYLRQMARHSSRWIAYFTQADADAGHRAAAPGRRAFAGLGSSRHRRSSLMRALKVLSPFYDPDRIPPPKLLAEVLGSQ
jgi:predicted metal-dependent hydrolase